MKRGYTPSEDAPKSELAREKVPRPTTDSEALTLGKGAAKSTNNCKRIMGER